MQPQTNTKIVAALEQWRLELKFIHTCLNVHDKATIMVKDLNSMGFQVSTLELETENLNSTFFVPLPKSRLSPSPCALPDHTLFPTPKDKKTKKAFELGKHFTGTVLLIHFLMTLLGLKTSVPITQVEALCQLRRSNSDELYKDVKWESTKGTFKYKVSEAFTICKGKPHLLITMASDCKATDKTLAVSELITLITFMRKNMAIEIHKKKHLKKRPRKHVYTNMICPILLISIVNTLQVRIIQAHYENGFKIQVSKLYDFNTIFHKEPMDLFIRWMIPRARGNTKWTPPLPVLDELSEEMEIEDST